MNVASDIEIRAVIRFLTLKGLTTSTIAAELKSVYGGSVCSITTVKKWKKRFEEGRSDLDDDFRSGRPPKSDLVKKVSDVLDELPFMSCKTICQMLEIPKTTCLRILHNSLGLKKFNFRWVPHQLSEAQKLKRVECSRELLRVLQDTPHRNIVTGDESWFNFDIPIKSAWAERREDLPCLPQLEIGTKKSLVSIFWSPEGLHSLLILPHGTTYNAAYFCDTVVPNLRSEICTQRRRRTLRGIVIHMDNARPHNAKISVEALESIKAKRVEHPPYSPDLAPSDFFLFGVLKEKLSGSSFSSSEDLISKIRGKFAQLDKEMLHRVYFNWIERLEWVVENSGEYYQSK